MFIHNGIEVDIQGSLLIDGNQYPANWFHDADLRAAVGIVQIDGTPPLVDVNQRAVRGAITEVDGVWTLHWAVVNLTADEIAARDATAAATLATARAALIARIDADVDAIYTAVVGNRSDEYNAANADATAFKAAGYAGAVPASVQSWATATGWTTHAAADDILAAAARLQALRDTIRAQRLLRKEQTRTASDVSVVAAAWAGALAAIRAAAGVP